MSYSKNSTKSNNFLRKPTFTNRQVRNFSQHNLNENDLYYLPKIEKQIARKALLQPTSLLTRYLTEHSNSIIKNTEEDMKRPIKISASLLKELDRNKKNLKFLNLENNNSKNITDIVNSKSSSKEKKEQKKRLKNKKNKIYLTDLNLIAEDEEENKKSENNNTINTTNTTNTNNTIITNNTNNINDNINNNIINISQNIPKKIEYPNTIEVNQLLPFEKCKKLINIFRRIRSYQPKIYSDWKNKVGLSVTSGKTELYYTKNDIYCQSNIFKDQTKLLESDILYYKKSIMTKDDFIEAFKTLSLEGKIKFNKALEETIGILILLPRLILLDFYEFILKFDNIKLPDQSKFVEKYIFNEVENLHYNNNLLIECLDFFLKCFEVYLILIKEVDGMVLKGEDYSNVITSYEKARYNISYITNASKNAIENYKKDVKTLIKFNKEIGNNDENFEKEIVGKMQNQFIFKKNEERQRKLRIDACFNYRKIDEDEKLKKFNRNNFKSIIKSDFVSRLLEHSKKDVRQQITTHRINTEIDGEDGEEGYDISIKRRVLKLNF